MKKPDVCQPGKVVEYQYDPANFYVSEEMKEVFEWDGCLIIRGLIDEEEVANVEKTFAVNSNATDKAWSISDSAGESCRLLIWFNPGDDPTGMLARSHKLAGTAEGLLGGEVFHYHTKLMMKGAKTGGSFQWHQDYGYWYKNGYLRPDLLTAFVAIDKCVKENGCLEVLVGSHRCGRIDHVLEEGQTVADSQRVELISRQCPRVMVPLNKGDCLFFHSNILHSSRKNESDMRRWCILSAYGRTDNVTYTEVHPVDFSPVKKVENDAIRSCNNFRFEDKRVMDPSEDHTVILKTQDLDGN